MRLVKDVVIEYQRAFNITPEQWKGASREAHIMYAKRAFAEYARKLGFTWREIAKACGKKDHTTMIKLCQKDGWREKNIKEQEGKNNDKSKRRI